MNWPALVLAIASATPALAMEACEDCHRAEADEFRTTAMARAALTPDFLAEHAGRRECLSCHAPSGGSGIGCRDCHGAGPHPFGKVAVPEACARCHDAPGESTVRRFRESKAAAEGRTCLDCHAARGSHAFRGPASDPAFLAGVAEMRLAQRREGSNITYAVSITHRSGHALPGGTTGRAVWLVLTGKDSRDREIWRRERRFGWLKGADGTWQDHTLPGEKGVTVEFADVRGGDAAAVEASLIYRFAAGPFDAPDPRQVELSRARLTLRQ